MLKGINKGRGFGELESPYSRFVPLFYNTVCYARRSHLQTRSSQTGYQIIHIGSPQSLLPSSASVNFIFNFKLEAEIVLVSIDPATHPHPPTRESLFSGLFLTKLQIQPQLELIYVSIQFYSTTIHPTTTTNPEQWLNSNINYNFNC